MGFGLASVYRAVLNRQCSTMGAIGVTSIKGSHFGFHFTQ